MSFFTDDKGNKSMMRLIVFMGSAIGAIGFLAGLAGFFLGKSESFMVMGASAALFGLGDITKWLQKMQENK